MKIKLVVLFLSFHYVSQCQITEQAHEKSLMIGIGPSLVGKYMKPGGFNVKISGFLKKDLLLFGYTERTYFLADAFDYGLGLRKYYGKSKHRAYLQPSLSYSTYQAWSWNTPPLPIGENEVKKTPKISGVAGVELSLGKHLNVNLEFGYGYYSNLQFGRMISRTSLNYVISKHKRKGF